MAKTDFRYSCGHDGRATGKNRLAADWLAAKYSGDQCQACKRAEREAAYAAENAQAQEAARAAGLPTLIGVSDKQTAYATTVRQKALDGLPDLIVTVRLAAEVLHLELVDRVGIPEGESRLRVNAAADAAVGSLDKITDIVEAKWWLDVGPTGAAQAAWTDRLTEGLTALAVIGHISERDVADYSKLKIASLAQ